jgi:hypothetical protein
MSKVKEYYAHLNLLDDPDEEETCIEVHADGVKEVPKCDFCTEPCLNEWCPAKEEK